MKHINVTMVLVLIFALSCEDNNNIISETADNVTSNISNKAKYNPGPYSDTFEFNFSLSYDELEFDGENSSGLDFSFEAYSNNAFNLSSPMIITPSYIPANPEDLEYDVSARVSQNLPTNISYDGSSIYYSGESSSLNTQEKSILDWVQDGLDDALDDIQNYSGGCTLFPCPNKIVSGQQKSSKESLQLMSKEEIIAHLESQGFDVEQVRGWEFRVSKIHKDILSQESTLSTTYIYNFKTGEISLNKKNRSNGLATALTKAEKLGDKNPRIQSLISRTDKAGLIKSLRMNSNRKIGN